MNALQGIEDCVEWSGVVAPFCGQGGIRIRVAIAGLNRADLLQKAGLHPPPPSTNPALRFECADVVSKVDTGSIWQVGDRVCALLAGDGTAEGVVVDTRHVPPVLAGLSLAKAAGVPEVYAATRLNLFRLAALQPGEKVLLHAGASGVGSTDIQLCKTFGNPCWANVGSAEHLAYYESLGAAGGALRKRSLEPLHDFAPFDVILNPVGARHTGLNLELLQNDGHWVVVGLMGGHEAQLDLARLLGKRIQLAGSTLCTHDTELKAQLIAKLGLKVWPLFPAGELRAQLERAFPIGDTKTTFEALAGNQVQGKVVLVMDPSLAWGAASAPSR